MAAEQETRVGIQLPYDASKSDGGSVATTVNAAKMYQWICSQRKF